MRARLTVETGSANGAFDLEPGQPVTLGRSQDNAIVIDDEHASRRHARVQFADGHWHLADLNSRNGTQLNGHRLRRSMPLADGSEIQIGSTVLRFQLASETPTCRIGPGTDVVAPLPPAASTQLQADELTALCSFMAVAVEDDDGAVLLRRALKAILRQTGAAAAAFVTIDSDDAAPRLVLPESASIDARISRFLTRSVRRDGRLIWLDRQSSARSMLAESSVADAVGVPMRSRAHRPSAVQVFKSAGKFTEREVRFCEAMVGSLAGFLQMLRVRRSLQAENTRLRARRADADVLIGSSPEMDRLRQQIVRVAAERFTLLITGETGVGKELVAIAVHRESPRSAGPLVVVNCAAIPPTMMETELFGYCKGALHHAERDYPGLFQRADDGTLLFDEIAELPLECQAKLLRVIEGKPFRPLGATTEINPDVRIIAATNRDLEREVRDGRFRADLYYRLRSLTIAVPPLRDHANDIPEIAADYVNRIASECRKSVTLAPDAVAKLCEYRWPGNVRELQRVLECAVVHADGAVLDSSAIVLGDLPLRPIDLPLDLEAIERIWAIPEALRRTAGNKTQAARLLGITRETLAKKMEKYGINGKDE